MKFKEDVLSEEAALQRTFVLVMAISIQALSVQNVEMDTQAKIVKFHCVLVFVRLIQVFVPQRVHVLVLTPVFVHLAITVQLVNLIAATVLTRPVPKFVQEEVSVLHLIHVLAQPNSTMVNHALHVLQISLDLIVMLPCVTELVLVILKEIVSI